MLTETLHRVENPKPLMRSISVELLSLTEKSFASQGSPDKWQPLAASTIKQRTKKGQWPGMILQVSAGGLAPSVQPYYSDSEAGLTASKPYAAIQQFGGQAGRGHKATLPARPYMPMKKSGSGAELTEEATKSILELARHFLAGS